MASKMLLLIAHGSRKQAANDEVRRLAERIASMSSPEYAAVVAAFLELAEPDIRQGVADCVALGADEVVAVPYFLAAGRHVAADIPAELDLARTDHPGVEIRQSQYLGHNGTLAELVLDCARHEA